MDYRLVVVGCGPKGLAIYAKAKALSAANIAVPKITIIERSEVAANWNGKHGFTDGEQTLGTAPEKDIGFPYQSEFSALVPDIDAQMFNLSWPYYQVEHSRYAGWVDRDKPAPSHGDWSAYLKWVRQRLDLNDDLVMGSIGPGKIIRIGDKWRVTVDSDDSSSEVMIDCDGIVFTGPGEPKRFSSQFAGDNVYDGQHFWAESSIAKLGTWRHLQRRIAVVGAGETTASIVCKLIELGRGSDWTIDVISTRGTLYSRGEGYHENRFFSDPRGWQDLSIDLRQELIDRTDRGVLSVKAIKQITGAEMVRCRHGRVEKVLGGTLPVRIFMQGESAPLKYDFVVVAMGFDALSFMDYFGYPNDNPEEDPLAALYPGEERPGKYEARYRELVTHISETIGFDLHTEALQPRLYLPMLGGLTQGPGFPNLSCLGLLSDRILRHSVALLNPSKMENLNV